MQKHINENITEITYTEDGKFVCRISKTLKQAALQKLGYKFDSFKFAFDLKYDPDKYIRDAAKDIDELFKSRFDDDRVDRYIATHSDELTKLIASFKRSEKDIKNKVETAKIIEKSSELTNDDRVDELNDLGIFKISKYAGGIKISSDKVLSLQSFKSVARLSETRINLKNGFYSDINKENLDVLLVASHKTLKLSQESIKSRLKARLERKAAIKHIEDITSDKSFEIFIEDGEYPEFKDGKWTDIGTGFQFPDKDELMAKLKKKKGPKP